MATPKFEDEHEIARLLMRWAHGRDYYDWEMLSACFHDNATIHIAWFSGAARDYIAQSRLQATRRESHSTSKHLVTGPLIESAGDRAFSICHATLHVRRTVGGVDVDMESWLRFFDLLEKRSGRWAIVKRTGVYEKDRLSPVDPKGFPPGYWDAIDLTKFPASKRFLCFAQVKNGGIPSMDFVSVHTPEEVALYDEGRRWLANR